jgi:hypothetical protein
MTRPNVVDVDVVNDLHTERQMTDAEYAQYLIDLESIPVAE